jgi:hypothetical protein
MPRSFPAELINCISEGRTPSRHDLLTLREKLAKEVRAPSDVLL